MLEVLVWPAAALILGLTALGLCRRNIGALIDRGKRLGFGTATFDTTDAESSPAKQIQASADDTPIAAGGGAAAVSLSLVDSPHERERRETLVRLMQDRNVRDREDCLCASLGALPSWANSSVCTE
jgi:hypothetical protein